MISGDWDKLQNTLDNLASRFKGEMAKQVGKGIKTIETKVLAHVDQQDLDWEPLTEAYAERKEKEGLDPDTLRATNRMYSNITTRQMDSFRGMTGVRRGVRTEEGDEVVDIAMIHEQPNDDGSKIPARKLWEPTYEEVRKELPEKVMQAVIQMVK